MDSTSTNKSLVGTSSFCVNHSLSFSSSLSTSLSDAGSSNGSHLSYNANSNSSHHHYPNTQSNQTYNINPSYQVFSSNDSTDKRGNQMNSASANGISSNHLYDASLKAAPSSTLSSNSFSSQSTSAPMFNYNLDNYYYSSQLQQTTPLDFSCTSLRTIQNSSTPENDRAANENTSMTLNPESSSTSTTINEPNKADSTSSCNANSNLYTKTTMTSDQTISENLLNNFSSYQNTIDTKFTPTTPVSPFAYGSVSSASSVTDNQSGDKSKVFYPYNQFSAESTSLCDPYGTQTKMNYSSETQQLTSSNTETTQKSSNSSYSSQTSQQSVYARTNYAYCWPTNNITFNNQSYDLNSSYYQLQQQMPQNYNATAKSYQNYAQADSKFDNENINIFLNNYGQGYCSSIMKTEGNSNGLLGATLPNSNYHQPAGTDKTYPNFGSDYNALVKSTQDYSNVSTISNEMDTDFDTSLLDQDSTCSYSKTGNINALDKAHSGITKGPSVSTYQETARCASTYKKEKPEKILKKFSSPSEKEKDTHSTIKSDKRKIKRVNKHLTSRMKMENALTSEAKSLDIKSKKASSTGLKSQGTVNSYHSIDQTVKYEAKDVELISYILELVRAKRELIRKQAAPSESALKEHVVDLYREITGKIIGLKNKTLIDNKFAADHKALFVDTDESTFSVSNINRQFVMLFAVLIDQSQLALSILKSADFSSQQESQVPHCNHYISHTRQDSSVKIEHSLNSYKDSSVSVKPASSGQTNSIGSYNLTSREQFSLGILNRIYNLNDDVSKTGSVEKTSLASCDQSIQSFAVANPYSTRRPTAGAFSFTADNQNKELLKILHFLLIVYTFVSTNMQTSNIFEANKDHTLGLPNDFNNDDISDVSHKTLTSSSLAQFQVNQASCSRYNPYEFNQNSLYDHTNPPATTYHQHGTNLSGTYGTKSHKVALKDLLYCKSQILNLINQVCHQQNRIKSNILLSLTELIDTDDAV